MKLNMMKNMAKKREINEPIEYVFDDTGYYNLLFDDYSSTYDFELVYTFIPEFEYEDN